MDDGLNIRWRETAPDRGLVTLALAELQALEAHWPGTKQCEIVIERAGQLRPDDYRVSVQIDFGLVARARGAGVSARATDREIAGALRAAFARLRTRRVAAAAAAA